jgi:uncharacterized protein YbbC (DUF1343 family)
VKKTICVFSIVFAFAANGCNKPVDQRTQYRQDSEMPVVDVQSRTIERQLPSADLKELGTAGPGASESTSPLPAQADPGTAQTTETAATDRGMKTLQLAYHPTPALAARNSLAKENATSKPLVVVESRVIGSGPTLSGLDVIKREQFAPLKGKRIALLTNHSAIDRDGNHLLDLMVGNPTVELACLFSPEHGLYGNVDTKTADSVDSSTGLMIHSLYSSRKDPDTKPHHPRLKDLDGIDVVVVDMQDIGARFYTYCSYMGFMMEACAKTGTEVIVLDRPNPIGGLYVDGPLLDEDLVGAATGYFRMPVVHGMTMGELARMFNAEKGIGCKLTIVEAENWKRGMFLDQTGLRWVNPSPNIQDLDAAIAYPGIGMTEAIVSMGRGTDEPFHVFGAPYIDNPDGMLRAIADAEVEGVRAEAVQFKPTGTLAKGHVGENRPCNGARITITDRQKFRSVLLGVAVMRFLHEAYGSVMVPEHAWNADAKKMLPTGKIIPRYDVMRLRGATSSILCAQIREGKSLSDILAFVDTQIASFKPVRAKYLIYPE